MILSFTGMIVADFRAGCNKKNEAVGKRKGGFVK